MRIVFDFVLVSYFFFFFVLPSYQFTYSYKNFAAFNAYLRLLSVNNFVSDT